ncbi:MAG: hypothetical protein KKB62_02485 [Nanoarchaeota archaeon]|nr:hypothetical protein [Nanoarchaeota archaeon]
MKKEIIRVNDLFKEKKNNLDFASNEYLKVKFLEEYSRGKHRDLFNDSKEYFILNENLNLAEDFSIKSVSFRIDKNCDYSYGKNLTNFYFDFFFKVNYLDEKIPIFIRHKNFSEDEHNIIYSVVLEEGKMDYKNYKGLKYKKESLVHPKSIEEILLIHKGRELNKDTLNKLSKVLTGLRDKNKEFYGEKIRYAKTHCNLGDWGGGWTSCGNCNETLEDYGKICPHCESVFVGSETHYV